MDNKCRLTRIEVKSLFNRFDYDIDLNNGNDVAILIAPNGCGKTTIFRLVDCIFNPTEKKIRKIMSIPFETVFCTLSDGRKVGYITSKKTTGSAGLLDLYNEEMGLIETRKQNTRISLIVVDEEEYKFDITDIIDEAESRGSFGENILCENLEFRERTEMYSRLMQEFLSKQSGKKNKTQPKKYEDFPKDISNYRMFMHMHGLDLAVNYISAERLHKIQYSDMHRERIMRRHARDEAIDPLDLIQEKARDLFRRADNRYRKLVSDARDKLPKMYLGTKNKTSVTYSDFEESWKEYVYSLEKYYQLGLLESNQTILEQKKLKEAYTQYGAFLTVYLEAFKGTLQPWAEEYGRMKLFADIINKRNEITGKKLKFDRSGLVMTSDDNPIELSCLSSGEKNDLVMFYNLIFNSREGSVVLIDEPEISLHIEWQEEYIDRLLEICEMNGLQAIVATHSPNIVNGHFELYVEKGFRDERKCN